MSVTFDATYYLQTYSDVLVSFNNGAFGTMTAAEAALYHYNNYGWKELRNPSADFNTSYYLTTYSDVTTAKTNPLTHFLAYGAKEGRAPNTNLASVSATFDSTLYLSSNADVQAAITAGTVTTAYQHWVLYGASEGRTAYNTSGAVISGVSSTGTTGSSFTLTTAADIMNATSTTAANKTTTGNDTIYGLTASSLTSADVLDASSGTDTLIADYDAGTVALSIAPTLTSVESVTLRNTGTTAHDGATDGITFSAASSTGITSVTFDKVTATTGVVGLYKATNLGAGTTVGITDNQTGAHVYTFQYTNAALAGSADTVALTISNDTTATGAVSIQNSTSATGANDGAETVAITVSNTSSTTTSTLGSLVVDNGTNKTVNKVTVAGSGNLTITNTIDFEGTTSGTVDASAATGNLGLTLTSGEAITFTGGSGKSTVVFGDAANVITGGAAADTFTLGTGVNTVTGNAGNDTVIGTLASFTAADSIVLGDGTRDGITYSDVTALNSTGVTAAQLTILAGYTGVEAIGSSQADVTAIDANYFTQSVFKLSGANAVDIAMIDVAGDTLVLATGIAASVNDALTVSGELPNSTFNLEMSGAASIAVYSKDGAAGDAGLTISTGISTVNILSTTTATSTTGLKNGISADADATLDGTAATNGTYAIANVSAGGFVLTGNVDFAIDGGKTAGFSNAVDFNATAFTGKLTFVGSDSADRVTAGTGNDTIQGLGGDDVIDLAAGGVDLLNYAIVTGSAVASGKDTITGFTTGNDKLSFDGTNITGGGSVTATAGTAVTAGSVTAAALTDGSVYVINNGATSLISGGTKTVTSYTDTAVVAAYLNEGYNATADNDAAVFLINDLSGKKTYVYLVDEQTGAASTIQTADVTLIGVITESTTAALVAADIA